MRLDQALAKTAASFDVFQEQNELQLTDDLLACGATAEELARALERSRQVWG